MLSVAQISCASILANTCVLDTALNLWSDADSWRPQQLLSAVLERELQLDTLSWSLTKAPELCYIELARAPTADEIARVQAVCNEAIAAGTEVRVKMALAGQDGVQLGEKVPENYADVSGERKPVMRTVEIVGLDDNP